MAPPSFADLGKSSRDLFSKHYHFGVVKIDAKSKTPAGVELSFNGLCNAESSRNAASVETKYTIKPHGVTLKQKWTSDNILTNEATIEDQLVRGLKTGMVGTFAPQNGKATGKLVCTYKTQFINMSSDVVYDNASKLTLNGSGVFGHQGWLAGMKVAFNPSSNKLSKSDFALGYETPELHVTGLLTDGKDLNCSVYQRINENLNAGVSVMISGGKTSKYALGCHHKIDKNSAVSCKIDDANQLGLGFVHRLRQGMNVTLSANMDLVNHTHKLGLGVDLAV